MEYMEETYCINCGSELITTGKNSLPEETYYTCPNCNMDYTVEMTDEYTISAIIDKTNK